jgi:hypothetical protein
VRAKSLTPGAIRKRSLRALERRGYRRIRVPIHINRAADALDRAERLPLADSQNDGKLGVAVAGVIDDWIADTIGPPRRKCPDGTDSGF